MEPFRTILIANRGEIALRIIRTARALGYRTVAVYSDADAAMPHVGAADAAVRLGAAPAAESYLHIDRLIEAARRSGAGAVHPGYGFLSESAAFAEACRAAGLVFVGPSAAAIRVMGDKAEAKRLMRQHGVPCIPGYDGAEQSETAFAGEAERIGYPVMLKAVAGGGGKGMRLVESPRQLAEGLQRARSEAHKAFGNGALMMEKAVLASRHVEVQVFGDAHGQLIHLGDRDCSIQRRHQKIIEEAPAPDLPAELRAGIAAAAIAAARAVDYVGAGTVEFLVTPAGAFWFLEMNTRLQVEHPVTEMVTGLDLVAWQLRVAAGQPLPLRQDQVTLRGHAIEARLYAEDPAADFLPQAGRIVAWRPPSGDGVRIDHGLADGAVISTFYDPMLAKLIGHGSDRAEARRRLVGALEDVFVAGVATNQRFLLDCLGSPAFVAAELDTAFLDHAPPPPADDPALAALPIAAALIYQRDAARFAMGGWRSRPWESEAMRLQWGERTVSMLIDAAPNGVYSVRLGEQTVEVVVLGVGDRARVRVDGIEQVVPCAWDDDVLTLSHRGACLAFREPRAHAGGGRGATATTATAPMPGAIAAVRVRVGDVVEKGDVLVVLEAMKMEHPLLAPMAGTVAAVHVAEGDQVAMRHLLVEMDPAAAE